MKTITIPAGKLADDDAVLKAKREELKRKLLEGRKVTIAPTGNVTGSEKDSTITVPRGVLAGDEELWRKQQKLKSKLQNVQFDGFGTIGETNQGKQKVNYLLPLMQRQWASHCAYPTSVHMTIFDTHNEGACQLVSNATDKLLLNIALDNPKDYKRLCEFKKHRFYNLFNGSYDIYELEFGGLTDDAIQITSEILRDVFDIATDKEIKTSFETWN